jgi:hypothetical protein
MKNTLRALSFTIILCVPHQAPSLMAQTAASNPAMDNAAMDKFKADMKTAALNGSITVAQLKELQTNAETLKAAREEHQPGAPVDLLTPYHAVSSMKAIMATVKQPDHDILRADVKEVLESRKPEAVSAEPPSAGKKLGKDVFVAVMFGKPTDDQVKQLQDSLNALEQLKNDSGRPMQALMGLKKSKEEIAAVMNAGSFRDQDRQAVLADLNNLGPQGSGMHGKG